MVMQEVFTDDNLWHILEYNYEIFSWYFQIY